jgi:hypothetical protein
MRGASECPACRRDIGVWPVILASTPNRFRCPHCRERVWYRGIGGVLVLFSVLLALLVIGALGVAWLAVGFDDPLTTGGVALGVLVLGYVPFEVAYALVLRGGGYQLESARHPVEEEDDEAF